MNEEYKKLSKWQEFVFSVGHIGPGMLNQFIILWAMSFYKTGGYLSAVLVGWAVLSGKLMDAIGEPFVANWSDNLRNKKYGRRLPFMMLGLIPLVVSFVLIWCVPSQNNTTYNFIWFFIWVNLFYFSYNAVVNPYFALLPEISKAEGDRARIQGYIALFGVLGMGITMGASGFLIKGLGYINTAVVLALFCAIVLFGPFITLKTNKDFKLAKESKRENTFHSVKESLVNKKFRVYLLGFGLFYFGFNMVQMGLAFIASVLLGLSSSASSTMFIASVVVALAFIPLYQKVIKQRGSKFALRLAIGSYIVVALLIPVLTQSFIPFPPMVRGLILMALMGFPYSGMMVIPNVLVSSIIDDDFKRTGVRREGIFFGTQGLIMNGVIALAAVVNGYIFDYLGSTMENPLGVIILGPLAAVLAVIGFIALSKLDTKVKAAADNNTLNTGKE